MKRTTTKEIFIEIETIRITKKRSARKKSSEQPKPDVSNHDDSFIRNDARLKYIVEKLF